MNCERARQVEMDEELKPRLLRELLLHQRDCADCRTAADEHARLLRLLEEWKLEPGLGEGLEATLARRIAERRRRLARFGWTGEGWQLLAARWLWPWRAPLAGAALALAILLSAGTLFRGNIAPVAHTPAAATAQSDPLVRDLQALDRDGDLLANFDFLNAQTPAAAPLNTAAPHSEQD